MLCYNYEFRNNILFPNSCRKMKKLATGTPFAFGWRPVGAVASAEETAQPKPKRGWWWRFAGASLFSNQVNRCSVRVTPALAKMKTCILMHNKILAPLTGNFVKGG
ncbi:hypothetical protein MNBD_NITROSPINAE02-1194 [hydrothermal vent metagenome]|uniref:Uncharacterized protein n=1 Tax=hydrothermal vent metagenome TaxID=652676 RepID=A0A3B1CBG5_9ZZZZ